MKKIIIIILAIAFVSNNSNAQNLREKFVFGLKAGANYSNVYDSQTEQFQADPKPGMAGGAFFAIPISKFIGIQPEILFSQRGFHATGVMIGSAYDLTRTTSYIDIPLLFAVKPNKYLTLLAGPQYSYLLKQKDVFSNGSISYAQEQEFKNDNIRKNILCFTGGMDINLRHLVLGARAGFDFQNNNGNGTSTTPRYKNAWGQVTIGYRFFDKIQ
jgi:hypothetical protein